MCLRLLLLKIMTCALLAAAFIAATLMGIAAQSRLGNYVESCLKTISACVISAQGELLYGDTSLHGDIYGDILAHQETRAALKNGGGFSVSDGEYRYAAPLEGGAVLVFSMRTAGFAPLMYGYIPTVAVYLSLLLCVSYMLSRWLADRISTSINDIDIQGENEPRFEEFIPLVRRLHAQKVYNGRQIFELENRLDTIVSVTADMHEGLVLTDTHGIIISANASAKEIFNQGEMTGKKILRVCRDMELHDTLRAGLAGGTSRVTLRRNEKVYEAHLSPAYENGEVSGVILLLLDITERFSAERQRREFSADVSHEMKTPLTTISAMAEMIGNGMAQGEDARSFARKISEQTARLTGIINGIIRLSEFDEGQARVEESAFNLSELAQSVLNALNDRAAARGVSLMLEGDVAELTANRAMIDEVIYNLVDNAINYNKPGGDVRVILADDGEFVRITVSDTGIGIAQEHLAHVFERFYRVDKSRSKKTGGTGLGLSIVRRIVESHRGSIEISSGVGVGTTVTCYIKNRE